MLMCKWEQFSIFDHCLFWCTQIILQSLWKIFQIPEVFYNICVNLTYSNILFYLTKLVRLICVCACVCSDTYLCPTLCNPMDCYSPGSSVHGIFKARILEWAAISYPGYHPNLEVKSSSPTLVGVFFTPEPPEKPV